MAAGLVGLVGVDNDMTNNLTSSAAYSSIYLH